MNKIVVAAVIKNDQGQVLAVHLNKEKPEGVWVMPGGKLEEGENARDCAIREAREELGIEIKPIKIVGISEVDYHNGNVWVFIYYLAEIVSGTPKPLEDGKTLEVDYVDIKQLNASDSIVWFEGPTLQ